MTSSRHGLEVLGDTRATVDGAKGSQPARGSRPQKAVRGSDCRLQPACMKLELLVTADQHAAVNMSPDSAHLARHTLGRASTEDGLDAGRDTVRVVEVETSNRGEGAAR
jgi:hypothetical protein